MNYFQNASVGFDKDAIITVPMADNGGRMSKMDALKYQLLQQTGIKKCDISAFSPMDKARLGRRLKFDNASKQSFNPELKWADADYFWKHTIFSLSRAHHIVRLTP